MRRKLALILSLIFLVTLAIPADAFADGFDKGLENAIKIAKTKFEIPESFRFESSISTESEGTKKVFRLTWSSETEDEETYRANVDENGTILNYRHYKSSDNTDQNRLPTYSKSDAKAFADKFLASVIPDLTGKLMYAESNSNSSSISSSKYNLYYTRIENGIPLYNDKVRVDVDRDSGEVTYYNLSWTDGLIFTGPSKAITAAKAQEAYKSKLGLRLIYKYSFENDKVAVYPVYVAKYSSNTVIDALTGLKIDIDNSDYAPAYDRDDMGGGGMAKSAEAGATADTVTLTPEEQKEVADAGKLISLEKAEIYARALTYLDLTEYKISYSNLSENELFNDGFSWHLRFYKAATKTSEESYASVVMNAVTGTVTSFMIDREYVKGEKGKIGLAEAKNSVDSMLKEFKPDIYNQLVYDDAYNADYSKQTDIPAIYDFTYVRKAGNDVLFPGNEVTIGFDAVNNKIVAFDMNWSNITFPSVAKAITLDTAYETLFESIGLELQYDLKYEEESAGSKAALSAAQTAKPQAVLVYSLKPNKPVYINAYKAELLDSDGSPYKENKTVSYTDITGNTAENEIKVLAEYGISLEGNEFKPSEAIIQKDFFVLFSKALGYYDSNLTSNATDKTINEMYNYLAENGIVKGSEKSVNARVTREDAVKFVIRSLKYDKIADLKDMFNCSFADKSSITPELTGYAVIAGNLKLIDYGNINFEPKSEMTRAETAVLIYKYLQLE